MSENKTQDTPQSQAKLQVKGKSKTKHQVQGINETGNSSKSQIFQRKHVYSHLNFLHQASQNMLMHPGIGRQMSSNLTKTMNQISRKCTVRLDPSVKRSHCKACKCELIPGLTSTIRVRPSRAHKHYISTKCLSCGSFRKLPAPQENEEMDHIQTDGTDVTNNGKHVVTRIKKKHRKRGNGSTKKKNKSTET